jgi:hypothetical protein
MGEEDGQAGGTVTTRRNEHGRWLGHIDISLEVAIDEDPTRLAEDIAMLAERAIADRPRSDTFGWSAKVCEINDL